MRTLFTQYYKRAGFFSLPSGKNGYFGRKRNVLGHFGSATTHFRSAMTNLFCAMTHFRSATTHLICATTHFRSATTHLICAMTHFQSAMSHLFCATTHFRSACFRPRDGLKRVFHRYFQKIIPHRQVIFPTKPYFYPLSLLFLNTEHTEIQNTRKFF